MKSIVKWVPSILVMFIIYLVSSTPGPVIQQAGLGHESLHITGHFALFFFLCISFYKATKNILLSIILSVIYGVLDEYHQFFTFERSPSIFDIQIDALGAIMAGIVLWKLQHILPKKLKNWLND